MFLFCCTKDRQQECRADNLGSGPKQVSITQWNGYFTAVLLFAAFYRTLREELSRKILKLVESGEMHSLKEKWWDARRRCLSGDDEMATTIKREGRCKEMAFILGMQQMGKHLLICIQISCVIAT